MKTLLKHVLVPPMSIIGIVVISRWFMKSLNPGEFYSALVVVAAGLGYIYHTAQVRIRSELAREKAELKAVKEELKDSYNLLEDKRVEEYLRSRKFVEPIEPMGRR